MNVVHVGDRGTIKRKHALFVKELEFQIMIHTNIIAEQMAIEFVLQHMKNNSESVF